MIQSYISRKVADMKRSLYSSFVTACFLALLQHAEAADLSRHFSSVDWCTNKPFPNPLPQNIVNYNGPGGSDVLPFYQTQYVNYEYSHFPKRTWCFLFDEADHRVPFQCPGINTTAQCGPFPYIERDVTKNWGGTGEWMRWTNQSKGNNWVHLMVYGEF